MCRRCGEMCTESSFISTWVSMSPVPVLCPVPLADKGIQGPLGPLAVPGLSWAEGICQGPSVDIATECRQTSWTWTCLECLGARIGAIARGSNGQSGWGPSRKPQALVGGRGLVCLPAAPAVLMFLLLLLLPPPAPTCHPHALCPGLVSTTGIRAV